MSSDTTIIIFLTTYFIALILISRMKTVYIPGRAIYLFRALFPSWRFFEDLCYLPVLYFRSSEDGKNFGPWEAALGKLERNWGCLFINSQANLLHAYHGLLQQLENDKEEVKEENKNDFIQSVSYQLTKNLVLSRILNSKKEEKKIYFQFKLSAVMQGSPQDAEDILISVTHETSNA